MSKTVAVSESDFQAKVLDANLPVLVDFWATWCGPCQILAPTLEELATEVTDKAIIAKIDVDANPNLAAQFGVRSIPYLLLFKNGQVVAETVGVRSKNELLTLINQHL